jgi:hypothetical protein
MGRRVITNRNSGLKAMGHADTMRPTRKSNRGHARHAVPCTQICLENRGLGIEMYLHAHLIVQLPDDSWC